MVRRSLIVGLVIGFTILVLFAIRTRSYAALPHPSANVVFDGHDLPYQASINSTHEMNCVAQLDQFCAQYYDNQTLTGTPILTTTETSINHIWGAGGPTNGVIDNFSARWTGTFAFEAGTYTLQTRSDDGIRVWINQQLLIDDWNTHSLTTHIVTTTLSSGDHTIVVEYFEFAEDAGIQVVLGRCEGQALLCNGDFKYRFFGWDDTTNADIVAGRSGYALQVLHTESNADVYQRIGGTFLAGKTYRLSGWCKADIGSVCDVLLADTEGNPSYESFTHHKWGGTGEWRSFELFLTMRHDDQLSLYLYNHMPNSLVLYDDLHLVEVSDVIPPTGALIINNGALTTSTSLVNLQLTAVDNDVVDSVLLANDTTHLEESRFMSEIGSIISDSLALNGQALQATAGAGTGYMVYGPNVVNLPSNTVLHAVFRLRIDDRSATGNLASLEVIANDLNGTTILAERDLGGSNIKANNQYQSFSLDFLTPSSQSSNVEFRVRFLNRTSITLDSVTIYTMHPSVPSRPWTVAGTPGSHRVLGQFLDSSGNISAVYSDTIDLIGGSELLAIYALAFDTDPTLPGDLSSYYLPILQDFTDITRTDLTKTVIMLVDLPSDSDTQLQVIRQGEILPINGLPDPTGILSPTLLEYDMTNSNTLGGFLLWARQTFPTTQTTFTYVGHNSPIVPDLQWNTVFPATEPPLSRIESQYLPPRRIIAPGLTDMHPQGLLSVHSLATALQQSAQEFGPFMIVDLVQCFAASLEQLYELAPSAKRIVASPHYLYFNPTMLGEGLSVLQATLSADMAAQQLIEAYDQSIPDDGHPRMLISVDTEQMRALDIREAWNNLSFYLLEAWDQDSLETRTKLLNAYALAAKYDTTHCPIVDWELAPPDAMVDAAAFANELVLQFGPLSPVGIWAETAYQRIDNSISYRVAHSGVPWFGHNAWSFSGLGIAIYADLNPLTRADTVYPSWQSEWYTDTASFDNPFPYEFLQAGIDGHSWADLLNLVWGNRERHTFMCLPPMLTAQTSGDIRTNSILLPYPATVTQGTSVPLMVEVQASSALINPLIQWTITQQQGEVFSTTLSTGYLVTGTHRLRAIDAWLPVTTGPFTLTVEVNGDRRIQENTYHDNILILRDHVLPTPPQPRPIISAYPPQQQWITQTLIPIQIVQDPTTSASPIGRVVVQAYQYQPEISPNTYAPHLIYEQRFTRSSTNNTDLAFEINVLIPELLIRPGPLILHIWGISGSTISAEPVMIPLNYAPSMTSINTGVTHFYTLDVQRYDAIDIHLLLEQGDDANIFVWYPGNYGNPTWYSQLDGNDHIAIPRAPIKGRYIVAISGVTPSASYTLNLQVNTMQEFPRKTGLTDEDKAFQFPNRPYFIDLITTIPHSLESTFLPIITR